MLTRASDTHAPGNTNPGARTRCRTWFITNFNDELKHFPEAKYEIWCKDTTKEKHGSKLHYHQVVHFTNAVAFSSIKKVYPTAHIQKPISSVFACINYIRENKNGRKFDIESIGEEPKDNRFKSIRDVENMSTEERMNLGINYANVVKRIEREQKDKTEFFNMLSEIEKDELKSPKIIYITGNTGKGKTYSAYKRALKEFKKEDIGKITLKNEFFDVVNENAKCFVIEEFRPSQIKASDFLQLTDKYGYRANVKGGFVTLRPEMILICSILKPEMIYRDELNQQFIRRISEIIDLDDNDLDDDAL